MDVTEVCNMALGMIGDAEIANIADDNHAANMCNRFFNPARDACLRDSKWNFALIRVELTEAAAPLSGWDHAYDLPPDCVRVYELNGSDCVKWEIEGRTLVTDEATAIIRYAGKPAVNTWDPLFVEAFATLLASKLALALKNDAAYSKALYDLYRTRYMDAQAVDGQEQGLPDQMRV